MYCSLLSALYEDVLWFSFVHQCLHFSYKKQIQKHLPAPSSPPSTSPSSSAVAFSVAFTGVAVPGVS